MFWNGKDGFDLLIFAKKSWKHVIAKMLKYWACIHSGVCRVLHWLLSSHQDSYNFWSQVPVQVVWEPSRNQRCQRGDGLFAPGCMFQLQALCSQHGWGEYTTCTVIFCWICSLLFLTVQQHEPYSWHGAAGTHGWGGGAGIALFGSSAELDLLKIV